MCASFDAGPFNLSNNAARFSTYHNLELNLYMLSKNAAGFFTRDVALVNKAYDNLDPRMGIAPSWLETLSANAVKAPKVEPPKIAAMIEPYNSADEQANECPEENREVGWWSSDDPDEKPVQLTENVPDFDAALTKAQVLNEEK